MKRFLMPVLGLMLATETANAAKSGDWEVNLPVGVTDISILTYDLHMFVIWICVAIGIVVFGVMIAAMIKFSSSPPAML